MSYLLYMGLLFSRCGNEVKERNEVLTNKLILVNNQYRQANLTIDELQNSNKILSDENQKLKTKINHSNDILCNPAMVSQIIIDSDLNCKWMDDDKEKEYLESIIKFLHVACSDLTYSTKPSISKKKKHTKEELKN